MNRLILAIDVYKRQAEQTRDGDELRRLSARDRQRPHAAFERRHALLENGRGRVHDARINICLLYTSRCV